MLLRIGENLKLCPQLSPGQACLLGVFLRWTILESFSGRSLLILGTIRNGYRRYPFPHSKLIPLSFRLPQSATGSGDYTDISVDGIILR